jgi:hypothetical protein
MLDETARERHDVAERSAALRETVGAAGFDPDIAGIEKASQGGHCWAICALGNVGPGHVINHDRTAD